MYRVLILENDPSAVRTLETICQVDLLQVDSVEQADSARELLRSALHNPPDLVLASMQARSDGDVLQALDVLAQSLPQVQSVLLVSEQDLRENPWLARRSERLLMKPLFTSRTMVVLRECLLLSGNRRETAAVSEQDFQQVRKFNAAGVPGLMESVLQEENRSELRSRFRQLGIQFACGFCGVLSENTTTDQKIWLVSFMKEHNLHVFRRYYPEGILMVFVSEKPLSLQNPDLEKDLREGCREQGVLLEFGFFTDDPLCLRDSLAQAEQHWMFRKPMLAALWGCPHHKDALAGWARQSILLFLMEDPEDLRALCRVHARELAGLSSKQLMEHLKEEADRLRQKLQQMTADRTLEETEFCMEKQEDLNEASAIGALLLRWSQQAWRTLEHCERTALARAAGSVLKVMCEQAREREFSLDRAASLTGYSASYLSQALRRYTGMTFTEWLGLIRTGCSLILLEQGMQMKAAAGSSGFQSSSWFGKVFRTWMGCTPHRVAQAETSFFGQPAGFCQWRMPPLCSLNRLFQNLKPRTRRGLSFKKQYRKIFDGI